MYHASFIALTHRGQALANNELPIVLREDAHVVEDARPMAGLLEVVPRPLWAAFSGREFVIWGLPDLLRVADRRVKMYLSLLRKEL